MSKYRNALPQSSDKLFVTDGGIETTLIFHEGVDLPYFAAFVLLDTADGVTVLRNYFRGYATLAKAQRVGLILDSPTWRANPDWATKLDYDPDMLAAANRVAIDLLAAVRQECETADTPIVVSGCIGPRGDGYNADALMSPEEAERYHAAQIQVLRETAADLVTALTMTYPEEAIGVVRAARVAELPVVISFTVETDGNLPNGQTLQNAVETVDAATDGAPAYYMINCAHPTHFAHILTPGAPWVRRLRGVRANASTKSHAELNETTELDEGDPVLLASQLRSLRETCANVNVLGGCCGTDVRHIESICRACA